MMRRPGPIGLGLPSSGCGAPCLHCFASTHVLQKDTRGTHQGGPREAHSHQWRSDYGCCSGHGRRGWKAGRARRGDHALLPGSSKPRTRVAHGPDPRTAASPSVGAHGDGVSRETMGSLRTHTRTRCCTHMSRRLFFDRRTCDHVSRDTRCAGTASASCPRPLRTPRRRH
jgi:hypothetical protein